MTFPKTTNTHQPAETPKPIAWLLLREGHAVPIFGPSPEELKLSREATIESPNESLKHLSGLNAIVDSLGFKGDFGDYQHEHWPKLKALLEKNGCRKRVDLFSRNTYLDLGFRASRRAFADRYFLGPTPRPTQVFLGTIDHFERYTAEELSKTNFSGLPPSVPENAPFPVLRDEVFANRIALDSYWNFIGDQLIRPATSPFVQTLYFTNAANPVERERALEKASIVVSLFRRAIDMGPEGWVDILPVTDNLLVLRAPDGKYDFVWKALRMGAPPEQPAGANFEDLPQFVRRNLFGAWHLYFDKDVWEERDLHEAESLHYESGGLGGLYYPGTAEVLRRYYESKQPPPKSWPAATADALRLTRVTVDQKVLAVSDLVTIAEFRRFMKASGYEARRKGENIDRANEADDPSLPVCVTFDDALAYCAHLERQVRTPVRLLTYTEHRLIRPNPYDAPTWKYLPPERRQKLSFPSAVAFDPAALGPDGRLKWVDDYPPSATWREPLPWATHNGLRFIDAWNAAEWATAHDSNAALTITWDGNLPRTSWGAYKMLKTCFRVVVDVGPDA